MRALALCLFSLATIACDGGVQVGGIVVTPEGVPIGGANVTLSAKRSSRVFTATSRADGCFWAGGTTAPGRYDYDVRVEAPGRKIAEGTVSTVRENYVVVRLQSDAYLEPSDVMLATADPCSSEPMPDVWRRAGLSRKEAEELVNLSLRLVLERKCLVGDLNFLADPKRIPILDTQVDGLELRAVDDVAFEPVSRRTLSERAEAHGSYVYYFHFAKVKRDDAKIIVELVNTPHYAQNPKQQAFGSGVTIEFTPGKGGWKHSCGVGWVG